MKFISILFLFTIFSLQLKSQIITGRVINAATGEALEYASIGVVNAPFGAITDKEGKFKIEIKEQSGKSVVRISMISFKAKSFTIDDLNGKENMISLEPEPLTLEEVVIKQGKQRDIGNMKYDKSALCGWGGSKYGYGYEIGTQINLGTDPAHLMSLHVHVNRQSFDSSYFRLHVRSISDNEPDKELLSKNIFITMTKETGWEDIDLSPYKLIFKGDVAVSLEWIKVFGVNKDRAMKINKKLFSEYILFNTKRKKGIIYTRWGSEAKWNSNNESPAIYLTVQ